jgi:O-antigen ligase
VSGAARIRRLPLDGPILAFSVWTLLSASFSKDAVRTHDTAKVILFTLFYLAVDSMKNESGRERVVSGALLGGLVLAMGAIFQFYFLGYDTLNHRPRSFMGHYMTASGLSMGVLMLSGARLAFGGLPQKPPGRKDWAVLGVVAASLVIQTVLQAEGLWGVRSLHVASIHLSLDPVVASVVAALAFGVLFLVGFCDWPGPATSLLLSALAFPLSAWALVLSQTRNAWLGSLAGLVVMAVLKAPRTLWLIPVGLLGVALLRPGILSRLTVSDPSSVDRYYMWQAGVDMIKDKPIFGAGPGKILREYPSYRWPQAPNPLVPHLHDNALQIAAERGLPCLAWWLWWMAAAMGDSFRETREGPPGGNWGAHAALSTLTAVFVAGLFEYNFGNSEVFMFLLIVVALPYALRRSHGVQPG